MPSRKESAVKSRLFKSKPSSLHLFHWKALQLFFGSQKMPGSRDVTAWEKAISLGSQKSYSDEALVETRNFNELLWMFPKIVVPPNHSIS